ncbi:MAG: NUDIX domain-containing protein [Chloroflexota bacterium]
MSLKWRILYLLARLYWFIFRPITIGVKVMLIEEESVWLVQHSYQRGWFLPGGGAKRNENLATAVRREAWEELGATLHEVTFFGLYSNITGSKSDHIAVFCCQNFTLGQTDKAEIRAVQRFPLHQLPADIGAGTRRRIEEFVNGRTQPEAGIW